MEPRKPRDAHPLAVAFLEALQDEPAAEAFVLGGGFALKHYLDYRSTSDIDAWWRGVPDLEALAIARDVFARVAASFGYSVGERSSGTMHSLEAFDARRKVFSFQVAVRDVSISEPIPSPWGVFRSRRRAKISPRK